jgi:hypothetical protein
MLARALDVVPLISLRGGAAARRVARRFGCELAGRRALRLSGIDLLVVDDPSPRTVRMWLDRARRVGTPTATIHDGDAGHVEADLVIEGGIGHHAGEATGSVLRGWRFALLDPRVTWARSARRRHPRQRRPRVLVALGGGSFVASIIHPLVRLITQHHPGVRIDVATGFCGHARRRLPGLARWIERPDGLARDLARSDVAVVGGGVTLQEACAVGVPAVALAVVAAQRPAIEAWVVRGAVRYGGALSHGEVALCQTADAVARLLSDPLARRRQSQTSRRLIDGRGTSRVSARLCALAATAAARRRTHV